MGFGTYQWVIEGNVYDMDPTTVLGLFTYGPTHHIGADAENEIDIEFSQWNKTCHACNADFTVYPSTGNRKPNGVSAWEDNFHVERRQPHHGEDGVVSGSHRLHADEWRSPHREPSQTSSRPKPTLQSATNIPQVAAPVGINLWCFKHTPAKDQSVVIRDFQFVAAPAGSL